MDHNSLDRLAVSANDDGLQVDTPRNVQFGPHGAGFADEFDQPADFRTRRGIAFRFRRRPFGDDQFVGPLPHRVP